MVSDGKAMKGQEYLKIWIKIKTVQTVGILKIGTVGYQLNNETSRKVKKW